MYGTSAPRKRYENQAFPAQERLHADATSPGDGSGAFEFSSSDLAALKSTHAGSGTSGVPYNNAQSRQLPLLREGIQYIVLCLTSNSLALRSGPAAVATLNRNHVNCCPFVSKKSPLPRGRR